MELTELEQAWRQLDTRLAGLEALAHEQRKHRIADTVRTRLRLLGAGQLLQLLIGVGIVVWAGPYWIGQWGSWHLVAYGLGLHVYGLVLLITAVVQLLAIAVLDYRQPVAKVQQRLLMVRRVRVWSERWGLVAGFTAWVPALFVFLAWIGLDVWRTNPAAVLANLAVGLALSAGVAWWSYRFPERFEREAVGGSLKAAEAEFAALTGG